MRRCADGDRRAFDRLVAAHAPALTAMLRGILHNDAAAEDALQDTLLSAWKGADGFRGDASVKTWLFTLARHCAFRSQHLRAGEPRRFADIDDLGQLGQAAGWGDASFDPERAAALSESRSLLLKALSTLTVEDREVIAIRDLGETSGPDAAAILGVPLATMKTRLHRARLKLVAAVRTSESHGGMTYGD